MTNLSKLVCHGESDKCRFGNPSQESNFQRLGIIGALLNQAIWTCLIGSMILSFVFVLLLGLFIAVLVPSNTLPGFQVAEVSKGTHAPALLGVVFAITVILIWAITYWFASKKFEDIYTRLRSRLVGKWELKLQTWRLAEEQKWVQHFIIYPIHLFIDQKNRQLKARIQQINSELFENQNIYTGNIHIDEDQYGYLIHIIMNARLELREPYYKYRQDISMTLLLSLKIKSDYSQQITHMRGVGTTSKMFCGNCMRA